MCEWRIREIMCCSFFQLLEKSYKMKSSATRKIDNLKKLTTNPKSELISAISAIDEADISNNSSVYEMLEELELKQLNSFISNTFLLQQHFL